MKQLISIVILSIALVGCGIAKREKWFDKADWAKERFQVCYDSALNSMNRRDFDRYYRLVDSMDYYHKIDVDMLDSVTSHSILKIF